MNHENDELLSTADVANAAERTPTLRNDRSEDSLTESTANRSDNAESSDARMDAKRAPLFPSDQAETFKSRWTTIQSGFVDEPRRAVEQADSLIAEVMKSLAGSFADERETLERQWGKGNDVSTEDLRVGLQRYRSFFDRLLSV